jgi:hypothetical protein
MRWCINLLARPITIAAVAIGALALPAVAVGGAGPHVIPADDQVYGKLSVRRQRDQRPGRAGPGARSATGAGCSSR